MVCIIFRTAELQDQLATVNEQIRQADSDIEETKGEKSQKYKDLKKRESDIAGKQYIALPCHTFSKYVVLGVWLPCRISK